MNWSFSALLIAKIIIYKCLLLPIKVIRYVFIDCALFLILFICLFLHYIYIYIYACMHCICLYMCIYVRMYVYLYRWICLCMCICVYICINVYMCLYVCMHEWVPYLQMHPILSTFHLHILKNKTYRICLANWIIFILHCICGS